MTTAAAMPLEPARRVSLSAIEVPRTVAFCIAKSSSLVCRQRGSVCRHRPQEIDRNGRCAGRRNGPVTVTHRRGRSPGRGAPFVPRPACSEARKGAACFALCQACRANPESIATNPTPRPQPSTFVGNAPDGSSRSVANWPQLRGESTNLLLLGSVLLTVAGNARTLAMPRETPAEAVLERSERVCACATRFERGCVTWTPAVGIFLPNQRATRCACRCV